MEVRETSHDLGVGFTQGDTVLVTGHIESEPGRPPVIRLRGMIASLCSVHPECFKLWPLEDEDPQLPAGHDGKLWFNFEGTRVEVVERDPDLADCLDREVEC